MTGFRFRWLGVAGFELRWAGATILVDPWLSRPPDARPVLPLRLDDVIEGDAPIQAILVTHGHMDHAGDVPQIARRTRSPVYASMSVCTALHDLGTPARLLHPLAADRTIEVGAVRVRAMAARHILFDLPLIFRTLRRLGRQTWQVLRTHRAYPPGETLGYELTWNDRCLVHWGSAGFYPEELRRLHPDGFLLPLQGHSKIHRIAAQMIELMRPKWIVPHHHDNFMPPLSEPAAVQPLIDLLHARQLDVRVIEPIIGEWMAWPEG